MRTHSGAYPPNLPAPSLVSSSHLWVKSHLDQLKASLHLAFRALNSSELAECVNLHTEWFPINYSPHFFEEINSSMISIAAVIAPKDYGDEETQEVVAGLIVFRVSPHHTLQYLRWTYLLSDVYSAYIATLGVVEELRGFGIGRELMARCRDHCESHQLRPQFVSLHVAAYNAEAVAFYERIGYLQVEHLRNHYNIEGGNYDAFVYILYINGGKPPIVTFSNAKIVVKSILRLPGRLKTLVLG